MSDTTVTKGEIVAAINKERDAWDALLAEVGEDRMLEPGPMGEWTFKDLTAHLSGWRERGLQRLEAAAHGQPEPENPWPAEFDEDTDEGLLAINDWFQQQSEEKLLGQVLDESRETFARLAEVVQRLPDDALTDSTYFPWTEGMALGEAITSGEFFGHLHEEHEADIRRWLSERGEISAPATQVEL